MKLHSFLASRLAINQTHSASSDFYIRTYRRLYSRALTSEQKVNCHLLAAWPALSSTLSVTFFLNPTLHRPTLFFLDCFLSWTSKVFLTPFSGFRTTQSLKLFSVDLIKKRRFLYQSIESFICYNLHSHPLSQY